MREIDTIAIEEEDWIEYIKRSTVDALDKMERAKIRWWNRTHKKMKWAAEWNPDLSSRYKTNRAIGRPRKRWEDDINDFLKQVLEEKEKEEPIERSNQTNNNWINIAKDWRRWGSFKRKLHKDCVKMTEDKMKTTLQSKNQEKTRR